MRRTRPAAGAFEQGGAPEAERLGGGDAPVPGDEQQPVQAASGTGADEDGAAELVGDVVTDLKTRSATGGSSAPVPAFPGPRPPTGDDHLVRARPFLCRGQMGQPRQVVSLPGRISPRLGDHGKL